MNGAASTMSPRCKALILLACIAALFVRREQQFLEPSLRAEDGPIFYMELRREGASAILKPYQGYLHVVPRLVGWAAARRLDPRFVPHLFAMTAFAFHLLLIGVILSDRNPLPGRGAQALATVLLPLQGSSFLHLTDLQFWLAAALLFVLASRPPTNWTGRVRDLLIAATAASTGPFVVLMAPLVALLAIRRRNPASLALLAVTLAGIAVQAPHLLAERLGTGLGASEPEAWARAVGLRLSGGMLLPVSLSQRVAGSVIGSWILAVGSGALVATAVFVHRGEARRSAAILVGGGLLALAGAMAAYRDQLDLFIRAPLDRYAVVPFVALASCLAAASCGPSPSKSARGLVAAALLASASSGFSSPDFDDFAWSSSAPFIGGDLPVDIAIEPYWTISYRPEAEGAARAPDAYERIASEALATLPSAINGETTNVVLARLRDLSFFSVAIGAAVEFAIPDGATTFRIECLHSAENAASASAGMVAIIEWIRPDGATWPLHVRMMDSFAALHRWRALPHGQPLEVLLPAGARGRLRVRTIPASRLGDGRALFRAAEFDAMR